MPNPEVVLARVARRQHGLFTLADALRCGFSRSTIRRRLAAGVWEELEPRVFRATAGGPSSWHQRLHAVVLWSGGVASRRSAAALYGLLPQESLQVTVVRNARSRRHGRHDVATTNALGPADLAVVDGIAATTPARTLIDLASELEPEAFEDVLDEALVRRIVTRGTLARRAEALRASRRAGAATVLRLLDQRHPQVENARNHWEARVLRLARRFGLPDPVPNFPVVVGGRRRKIDAAWPRAMVAVEFDGFVPHSNRRTFDDDRVRQNDLVDAGWKPFRLTSAALDRDETAAFAPVARGVRRGLAGLREDD